MTMTEKRFTTEIQHEIRYHVKCHKGCLSWGMSFDSYHFDLTLEAFRNMSQHLSFTLATKNPEDIKKVVDFAVELTKEEFEKHSVDYTELPEN